MTEKDDRLVLRDAISRGLAQRRKRIWEESIKEAVAKYGDGNMDVGIGKIADTLVSVAALGEQWAIREIGDRLDGKPAQANTHEHSGTIAHEVVWPLPKSPREK